MLQRKEPISLLSATHKDGTIYSVGDRVCIYRGRFGHNNIMVIQSIWDCGDCILVSENKSLPGTYIDAIKYKISDKLNI